MRSCIFWLAREKKHLMNLRAESFRRYFKAIIHFRLSTLGPALLTSGILKLVKPPIRLRKTCVEWESVTPSARYVRTESGFILKSPLPMRKWTDSEMMTGLKISHQIIELSEEFLSELKNIGSEKIFSWPIMVFPWTSRSRIGFSEFFGIWDNP